MKRKHVIGIVAGLALMVALLGGAMAQDPGPGGDDPDGLEAPVQQPFSPDPEVLAEPESQPEPVPVVVAPESVDALVTSAFTYQGQLKFGGLPVNGTCDFNWYIFATSAGGAALATDSDTLAVTAGLFTAVINVPTTLIDGNARYLEIRVRCPSGPGAYTTLTPRQELHAAPYALGLRLPLSHTISNVGSPIFAVTNSSTSTGSPSFLGQSGGGDGVRGISTGAGNADNGVYGQTNSTDSGEAGVKGVSTSNAAGGYFSSSAGAALYANGDARQSLTGDGFVKAAVFLICGNSGSSITRYFNNVNTSAITAINGASVGRCTIDFGFSVRDSRYVVAIAYGGNVARIVTFDPGSADDRFDFFRFDQNGTGVNGAMMVLIY